MSDGSQSESDCIALLASINVALYRLSEAASFSSARATFDFVSASEREEIGLTAKIERGVVEPGL
jgi:hypothetical protein